MARADLDHTCRHSLQQAAKFDADDEVPLLGQSGQLPLQQALLLSLMFRA